MRQEIKLDQEESRIVKWLKNVGLLEVIFWAGLLFTLYCAALGFWDHFIK